MINRKSIKAMFRRQPSIKKQEEKVRSLFIKLLKLKPSASNWFLIIKMVKDPHFSRVARRFYFRKACIDSIFCLLRADRDNKKNLQKTWEVLVSKLERNNHSKLILLQAAEDVPDLITSVLEQIEKLELNLIYEETARLLESGHLAKGTTLYIKIEELHEKLAIEKKEVDKALDALELGLNKLKQLRGE